MEPWTVFLAAGADPDFWQHAAGIIEDLVHMPDHSIIARRLRGARETDSVTPIDSMVPTTRVERLVVVDGAEAIEVDGSETPRYLMQGLDEVGQGLIRVMPAEDALDGRTHMYRLPLGDCRIRRDEDVPRIWAPIPSIESAYGIRDRYAVTSATTAVRMAAERSGRYLSPAVHIRCTDGDLRVDLIRPERRWMRAQRLPGFDWMICDPERPGEMRAPTDAERERLARPAVYTVDAGLDLQALFGVMSAVRHHMREWVDGDEGSMTNLLLMAAAPTLRLDQDRAYVTQGDGQIGKSQITLRMAAAYGGQSMAFQLAVLGQGSGTAVENLMSRTCSHLVAVSDDYDPRGGSWGRVVGPLKILLTGQLPYPARRIGCDIEDTTPTATHYVSTNFAIPVDTTQTSERRRFAFITGVNSDAFFGGILPLCERYGDWILVAVSAVAWWQRAGEHAWVAPLVTEASLPDGVIDAMRLVADQQYIEAAQIRSLGIRPADLPLRRRKKPAAFREPGEVPQQVYMPPRRGVDDQQMCDRYDELVALIARLDAESDAEDRPQVEVAPIPDGSAVSDIHTIDDWTDAIAEAGPRIFPVHGEDGPAGTDGKLRWTAKAPDSAALRRLTGESSWQRWARQERPGMGHVSDPSIPAWGMTLAPRYLILDCDIPHDGDGDDGWTVLQREVGQYGSDALPRTWAVRTPSGGTHLLYRLSDDLCDQRDGGALVRTRADARTHVDTRVGGTGYVIAAGSHCAAGDYTPIDRPDGGIIPTVTAELTAFLRQHGYIEPSAAATPARDPLAGMWRGMTGGDRGQLVTGTTVRISPPHMTAGATHDAWVGWTWGIVSRACDEQWDDRTLELVLRAGMTAVPSGHDPRDTMRAITDACARRGRSVPAGLSA